MEHLVLAAECAAPPYAHSGPMVPLGTRTLASYLRARLDPEQIRITVLDLPAGAPLEEMIEQIAGCAPSLVGLSCYLWNYATHYALMERLPEALPGAGLLLGGPHVAYDREDLDRLFARLPGLDLVVQGEGERALLGYLSTPPGQRPGKHTVLTGEPLAVLDEVGAPIYARSPPSEKVWTVALETCRGCVFRCAYCFLPQGGRSLRFKSRELLLQEYRWAVANGISDIDYADSGVNFDDQHLDNIVSAALEADVERRLSHGFEVDYRRLQQRQVERLKRLAPHVGIGIQSINPEANRLMQRSFDPEAFERVMGWLEDAGISVSTELLIGAPGDTLDWVKRSVDYALGFPHALGAFVLRVLPGSELYRKRHEYGLVYDEQAGHRLLESCSMTGEDIEAACEYVREVAAQAADRERRDQITLWDEAVHVLVDPQRVVPGVARLEGHADSFFAEFPGLRRERAEPQLWEGVSVLVCTVELRTGDRFKLAFAEPGAGLRGIAETDRYQLAVARDPDDPEPSAAVRQAISTLRQWGRRQS